MTTVDATALTAPNDLMVLIAVVVHITHTPFVLIVAIVTTETDLRIVRTIVPDLTVHTALTITHTLPMLLSPTPTPLCRFTRTRHRRCTLLQLLITRNLLPSLRTRHSRSLQLTPND
jgi:hypothetical protein